MTNRRNFLKQFGLASAALAVAPNMYGQKRNRKNAKTVAAATNSKFVSRRPPVEQRSFTSPAIEAEIKRITAIMKDEELAWLFENCYPNTLDTTVKFSMKNGKPDSFVITGDIDAMWLRDSSAQVWPYLHLAKNDAKIKELIQGLIARQAECINIDPFANAFNNGPTGSEWKSDHTKMIPELHERKWEIDSLCYPVRLAYHYWKTTGDTSVFTPEWKKSTQAIYDTFRDQQRKESNGSYSFQRTTRNPTDTCAGKGYGNPIRPVGLICSNFRPSDDSTTFLFLIPSNYFAVTSLKQLQEIYTTVIGDTAFATKCGQFAEEVKTAINQYTVHKHPVHGDVIAFEVDGFGNRLFMDDSNIPSLLALPYLGGLELNDPLYQRTRGFVLSADNPYFFKGKVAEGIGGPHVGMNYIWHMSIIMRIMTSTNETEILNNLRMLKNTHAGTGFMHEGFHKDDASNFTRSWFAWTNTLFGEMIIKLSDERPHLLQQVL